MTRVRSVILRSHRVDGQLLPAQRHFIGGFEESNAVFVPLDGRRGIPIDVATESDVSSRGNGRSGRRTAQLHFDVVGEIADGEAHGRFGDDGVIIGRVGGDATETPVVQSPIDVHEMKVGTTDKGTVFLSRGHEPGEGGGRGKRG